MIFPLDMVQKEAPVVRLGGVSVLTGAGILTEATARVYAKECEISFTDAYGIFMSKASSKFNQFVSCRQSGTIPNSSHHSERGVQIWMVQETLKLGCV